MTHKSLVVSGVLALALTLPVAVSAQNGGRIEVPEAPFTHAVPIGGEMLAKTTCIHRVNTRGGVAPAGACAVGAIALVPYGTDYFFYRKEKRS
jgi:hypothetical protein